MTTQTAQASKSVMHAYRSPRTFIRRFIAKRASKSALILSVILGLYTISKASSFLKTYPTELSRQKLAETLGSNIGIEALLGTAHHIETVAGYAVWNFLCLIAAGGAIWALLLATKTFRGEEDSNRWELLLTGQTTARRAAANALLGLASGLVVMFVILSLAMFAIGRMNGANFTTSGSLFFALALTVGAAEFMAVGALASQLMPIRSRATSLSVAVFGVFYMLRLAADTTSAHWLLNLSPLGWIEKLQPMYASQPLWLLPIIGFVLICSALVIFLAGRRDLGESTFADRDTAQIRTRLLRTPFRAAIRLTKTMSIGWLLAIGLASFLYGELAKGAVQAFTSTSQVDTNKIGNALSRLTDTKNIQAVSSFMGITFFLVMVIAMFYAAGAISHMRDDEAQGYLDNFLVRPFSRIQWLRGRVFLATIVVVVAGLLSGIASWAGEASQHSGVAFHTLLLAGINIVPPVILVLGIGVFAIGLAPRLTSFLTYGAVGWSFLVVMLSSGLTLNHWLLDTSILHHVAFAPATNPQWGSAAGLLGAAIVLGLLGAWRFKYRDLENE